MCARHVSCLVVVLALAGCDSGFAEPSELDSLRVLAVRPEPASGAPGQSSILSLVYADGTRGVDGELVASRAVQIAWFGGCHNPPSRQFFACYPLLTQIAGYLAPRVLDTQLTGAPPGFFGTGPSFELRFPEDLLSAAPKTVADPVHYGVSFAFFAACAGELRARPDFTDRVPVECLDPVSGVALGHRDFVTGFTTLYSYDDGVPLNQNPSLSAVEFGGVRVEAASTDTCRADADCAGLVLTDGFEGGCDVSSGRCLPRVSPCRNDDDCSAIELQPVVDAASAEPLPGQNAREILWANFFATAGSFDTPTELVNDRASGWVEDHAAYYTLPSRAVGRVELWVTVNDQRGGADYRNFQILVRDHD